MPVQLHIRSKSTKLHEPFNQEMVAFINDPLTASSTTPPASAAIVAGLELDRAAIKKMVAAYRTIHRVDPYSLKFIHFNLKELLTLFVKNQVVDPTKSINDQLSGLDSKGCKIYLGNHVDESTCPPNPDPIKQNPYLYMDTAIVCNTQLDTMSHTWIDLLKDATATPSSVTILGAGEGLDRGSICPPNCPGAVDPDGYYHQDILP